jgi:hypothetical protein
VSKEVAKTMFKNKLWLVMGICIIVAVPSSDAFAWRRDGPREVVIVGHNRYHYRDGRFYRHGLFGFGFVAVAPPIGAIVRVLPSRHTTIIVRGGRYRYYDNVYYTDSPSGYVVVTPPIGANVTVLPSGCNTITVGGVKYYYYDNVYYTDSPSGYVVVPAPAATPAVVAAPAPSGETVVINIPNASGGHTPVTLVKDKDGYIGPQGEYYQGHPTVDQLKVLYGN